MKSNLKNILYFSALIIVVILVAVLLGDRFGAQQDKFTYSDLMELFDYNLVESFEVDTDSYIKVKAYTPVRSADGIIVYQLLTDEHGNTVYYDAEQTKPVKIAQRDVKNGKEYTTDYTYRFSYNFQLNEVNEMAVAQSRLGLLAQFNYEEPKDTPWFILYLPYIIILVAMVLLYVFMIRQTTGRGGRMNSFSRARTKLGANEKNPVRFIDVAGADEEKHELQEVVEFLRDPMKFIRLGARIPRGVLLVGPPGTGKTLLAKAVAGEAGVPFYSISGSDFVEMYVGVGAARVRDLFETARRSPASIIFIDEIDAVGRHRGAGLGGGHDEREQTLNQLLVEMDGFGNHEGVIVIAATNRPDILDPALLRPGRFDRQITVNYPDLKGREEILKVHVRNKPLEPDVDLKKVAQTTVGFTGADLANLLNEAALMAASKGKSLIGMNEIDQATLKVIVGTEKKKTGFSEEDKKITAYHEAGHAVLAHLLEGLDPVTRISIIPTSKGAGGYTLTPPQKDVAYEFRGHMINEITMILGGRTAEELVYGDFTGGASSDIKHATSLARRMITVYGMSDELGTVCLAGEHYGDEVFLGRDFSSGKDYSEVTAAKIDGEIKRIIEEAHQKAKECLTAHMSELHRIVEFLMKHEVMDGDVFNALMDNGAGIEDLEAILHEKEEKSRRANEEAHKAAREKEEQEKQTQFRDPYSDFVQNENEKKQ